VRVVGLLALALGLVECVHTADCRPQTVLVSFRLVGQAATADNFVVDVSIDGAPPHSSPGTFANGTTSGTIEVTFPHGFPAGRQINIVLRVQHGSAVVGERGGDVTLRGSCGTLNLLLDDSGQSDLMQSDLTTQLDLLTGQSDLALPPDLSTAYTIGGTVTGLSGSGLVLANSINGATAEQLSISTNGTFQFPTKAPSGGSYAVTILTQPATPIQSCTVTAGASIATADVSSIQIACPPFVVASDLDQPYGLKLNGTTLYFVVGLYPSVVNCYTTNPNAGDRFMMVPTSGGTPVMIDYLENSAGNCGLYGLVFDSSYVYWANYPTGNIKRATLAGTNPSLVATVEGYLNGLTIGGANLYYHSYPNMWIGRVTTAGAGKTTFASTASINGANLATDSNYLYWTDNSVGTVNKVAFNVSSLPASPMVIVTGESSPTFPFVTSTAIYWLQPGTSGALRYAPLAAPAAASLNTTPLPTPESVVVDGSYAWVLAAGAGPADGRIYKLPLGGGPSVIVAQGLFQPTSLAMDSASIYWTNNSTTQPSGTRNSDGTIMMILK
jgi:hypothetical protein